jgi:hypothetical protein
MPLVEFMLHPVASGKGHRSKIPDFIRGSSDFFNPADNTHVGWVPDNRDFYLPDSVVVLTKETFTQRLLAIHQVNPMRKESTLNEQGETVEGDTMTDEEVTTYANEKYDFIVNHCKTEEGSL